MTQASKLKKTIRSRARKTGESYAAARRQVLVGRARRAGGERPAASRTPVKAATPSAAEGNATTRGGLSDAKSIEKTGHGLGHWFAVLDAFGAAEKGHTAAARHLYDDHGVPGWYCQGITVAYERARGLRDVNQSCEGGFQVSVSRVVPASVAEVVDALRSQEQRARWLAGADPELVLALRAGLRGPKGQALAVRPRGDARLRFKWGRSTVEIRIDPRGVGKASIAADNEHLPTADLVETRRRAWQKALDGLRLYASSR
jgi:uncharacterized protein YndB with AHSA1/START domain